MSKTESIPVARREREAEDIAAYTGTGGCEHKRRYERAEDGLEVD